VEQRGILPWTWIESEEFTHVFYPETGANLEEWQQSGKHVIDFLAYKCGVQIQQRRVRLEPGAEAFREAEEFLKEHDLERKAFLSSAHVSVSSRHWPHSKLTRISQSSEMPLVVFGGPDDPTIPGSIPCFGKSFWTVVALIELSAFYIGSDSGVSWLATTTNTPMGVFLDPARQKQFKTGYREVLRGEKDDIEEWGIHTGSDVVLDRVDLVTQCPV
jgi:ADP-heptose:LPS heptosyltransferase